MKTILFTIIFIIALLWVGDLTNAYTVPMEPIPSYHTFTEHMFHVCRILTDRFFDSSPETLTFQLSQAMSYILSYSERHDIDLLWHVEQKMKYNELRPMLNGNAVVKKPKACRTMGLILSQGNE